ncbi:BamA/TamA family outer membrane protein [candidate division TA06 bacterium]|uniref:BamA/TamA family outer membrane protein n=1 Tax=candidate division TA06 bacterium TaxID=2250710 RepID=A0A933ICD2_UNCT6|nr:BamA/TamA family outer membrane protein [candidate division TA06 bacterium]
MKNYHLNILFILFWLPAGIICQARAEGSGNIEISITGNVSYSASVLKKQMKFRLVQGKIIPESLETATGRLKSFYSRQGYLDAGISHKFIDQQDGSASRVEIYVQEGRRCLVEKIIFRGNSVLDSDRLIGLLKTRAGQGLDLSALGEDDFILMLFYADLGYIYAEVEHELNYINPGQAELVFTVAEGLPAKIGRVIIRGNLLTQSLAIERELALKSGDTFSRRALLKSQFQLLSTGLFKEAKVAPGAANPDRSEIDIEVEVKEKTRHVFAAGFGYGSGDAFRLTGSWADRNIGGMGRTLEFKALTAFQVWSGLKTVRRQAKASYMEPWLWGGRTQSEISFYYDDFRPPYTDYRLQIIGLDFMLGKMLGRYSTLGARWKQEWLKLSPDWSRQGNAADTISYRGRRTMQLFGEYRRFDDPVNPRSGFGYEWQTDYTGGLLGGTETYQRLANEWIAHFNPYRPLGISARLKYGIIGDWALHAQVPPYEKYFLGGPTTIRGFSSGRMGQVDASGSNIGGDKMGLVNIELKIFFPKHWVGVLFADAGLLENCKVSKLSVPQWHGTPGFGARYVFPFGAGRADLAFPSDKIDQIKYWRAVLAWGEAF